MDGRLRVHFDFQVIQAVVYFGAVVALLYYYGIMQAVLKRVAWLMQLTLGTTATESLNAVGAFAAAAALFYVAATC